MLFWCIWHNIWSHLKAGHVLLANLHRASGEERCWCWKRFTRNTPYLSLYRYGLRSAKTVSDWQQLRIITYDQPKWARSTISIWELSLSHLQRSKIEVCLVVYSVGLIHTSSRNPYVAIRVPGSLNSKSPESYAVPLQPTLPCSLVFRVLLLWISTQAALTAMIWPNSFHLTPWSVTEKGGVHLIGENEQSHFGVCCEFCGNRRFLSAKHGRPGLAWVCCQTQEGSSSYSSGNIKRKVLCQLLHSCRGASELHSSLQLVTISGWNPLITGGQPIRQRQPAE